MRKAIAILMIVLLLNGCIPDSAVETEASAPASVQTAEAPTEEPTPTPSPEPTQEPTPTPIPEAPYADARKPYSYIWENERDRKWEEDIVYLANTFLDPYNGHPLLSDRVCTVLSFEDLVVRYAKQSTENFYDAELKIRFIEKINELIVSIPDKTDIELSFAIQETVAMLHDTHSYVVWKTEELLPLTVAPVETEEGTIYVIESGADVLGNIFGMQLVAINDVPLEEIAERTRPLLFYENEYAFRNLALERETFGSCELLRYIGVIGEERTVHITVLDADGKEKKVSVVPWSANDSKRWGNNYFWYFSEDDHEWGDDGRYVKDSDNSTKIWAALLAEGEVLYFRINSCNVTTSFEDTFTDAFASAKYVGKLKKVIIDFRGNTGGYPDLDGSFLPLVTLLKEAGAETYILIDGGSFSAAIGLPAVLRRRVENAKLVGTPGGQPVRFFVGNTFTLPNSGITVACSAKYYDFWPGYEEGEALMPDVIVYQTLDDFLNGYDSVMKYILEQ